MTAPVQTPRSGPLGNHPESQPDGRGGHGHPGATPLKPCYNTMQTQIEKVKWVAFYYPNVTMAQSDSILANEEQATDNGGDVAALRAALETVAEADGETLAAAAEQAETEEVDDLRETARGAEQTAESLRKTVDAEVKARGGTDRHTVVTNHNKYVAVEDGRALHALQQAGGDPEAVTKISASDLATEAERVGMDVEALISRYEYQYVSK